MLTELRSAAPALLAAAVATCAGAYSRQGR